MPGFLHGCQLPALKYTNLSKFTMHRAGRPTAWKMKICVLVLAMMGTTVFGEDYDFLDEDDGDKLILGGCSNKNGHACSLLDHRMAEKEPKYFDILEVRCKHVYIYIYVYKSREERG